MTHTQVAKKVVERDELLDGEQVVLLKETVNTTGALVHNHFKNRNICTVWNGKDNPENRAGQKTKNCYHDVIN